MVQVIGIHLQYKFDTDVTPGGGGGGGENIFCFFRLWKEIDYESERLLKIEDFLQAHEVRTPYWNIIENACICSFPCDNSFC